MVSATPALVTRPSKVPWHGLFIALLSLPALWVLAAVVGELNAPGSWLGADPADALVDFLGTWALRLLLLTLAVSPLRRRLGWSFIAPWRRTAGLFAFGYLTAHLLGYAVLLNGLDWQTLLDDLTERRYIIAGMLAFALLTPLAVTSTRGWQRRLRRRWQQLHRLVFPATGAALLHLLWLTRDGYGEPLLYLGVFLVLLAERAATRQQSRRGAVPG